MVYSASIATAEANRYTGYSATWFSRATRLFSPWPLAAALLVFLVPARHWQQAAPLLFLGGMALLVAVLVPAIGREVNGARRWLALPLVSVQPLGADEARRRALCRRLHRAQAQRAEKLQTRPAAHARGDARRGVAVAARAGFRRAGGDCRERVRRAVSGRHERSRICRAASPMLLAGFAVLVLASPYRMHRIFGYMDPWSDPFGSGYQLSHALIGLRPRRVAGRRARRERREAPLLPEAHTDFLLAVLAEELGLAGVAAVIALFAWIVARAFAIAREARSRDRHFAALAAQGIGIWLGAQAFINMGVNMDCCRPKA